MKIRKLLHRSLELPIQKKSKSWAKKAARQLQLQRSACTCGSAATSTVGATHALARHAAASAGARNSARNHRTRGYGCARGELATVAVQPHNQKPHHRYDRERTRAVVPRCSARGTLHAPLFIKRRCHEPVRCRNSHTRATRMRPLALPARWHCRHGGTAVRARAQARPLDSYE